ncbi:hypothetical protein FTX61_21495 [Nitriliruptoraceae bacterium ZYF776]|nr:hypothetical protein [Profundirhabdus halotolerans]
MTERPTFAQRCLLSDLNQTGTTVASIPLVEERGAFANLPWSFVPVGRLAWQSRVVCDAAEAPTTGTSVRPIRAYTGSL